MVVSTEVMKQYLMATPVVTALSWVFQHLAVLLLYFVLPSKLVLDFCCGCGIVVAIGFLSGVNGNIGKDAQNLPVF